MKTHTINICLIPESKFYDICCKLNSSDTGNYNLNSRLFIPHITLGMKTLNKEQIKNIFLEIQTLNLNKAFSTIGKYYYKEFSPGETWAGIYIEKNEQLERMQKQVLEISKKYLPQIRTKQTYAIDDFYKEKEIIFYKEDQYLERPDFHITLGTQDLQKEYEQLTVDQIVSFDKLVIGKIGNYGSVREILYEIHLI